MRESYKKYYGHDKECKNKKEHSSVEFEKDGCKFVVNIYNTNANANGAGSAASGDVAAVGGSNVAGDDQAFNDDGTINQGEERNKEIDKSANQQVADRGGTNVGVRDVDVDINA